VQEARAAGVAYLIAGALYLLFGLRGLMRPAMLPYEPPRYPFLHQYGMGIGAAAVGVVFVAVGVVLYRWVTPAEPGLVLVDRYEAPSGLGPVLAVPLLLLLGMVFVALPQTLARGGLPRIPPGQLVALLIFTVVMSAGIWVALHYRRDAVVDPRTRAVEIRYGKPWVLWRKSFPIADFQWLEIETVERQPRNLRYTVYRVVAGRASGRRQMIGFWYSRGEAEYSAREIAAATGWEDRSAAPAQP
jgi:hypothetical protein